MGKKLTITMTNRPPVTVDTDAWPIVARADDYDGGTRTVYRLTVRQHADGRAVVYGVCEAGGGGQYVGFRARRAGVLAAGGIIDAIHRVCETCGLGGAMAELCIASLPAEELT